MFHRSISQHLSRPECLLITIMLPFVIWRVRELRTIANPLAVGPSERRVERLLKTINLQPSLSPALNTTNTTSAFLSKAGTTELICQCGGCSIQGNNSPYEHIFSS